jgi:hypothetical protein
MQTLKERFFETHDDYFETSFKYPNIRIREFKNFKKITKFFNPKKILEFPADGMMLNQIYPNALIDRAEMLNGNWKKLYSEEVFITTYTLKNIKNLSYDAIIGITPIHHATNKQVKKFIESSLGKLKSQGVLMFGDVFKGSKEAIFLDKFVNANSKNGHKGNYPDFALNKIFKDVGFSKITAEILSCPWVFKSEYQMCIFIKKIFGLNKMTNNYLLKNLKAYLGYRKLQHGIYLNWHLIYFSAKK